MRRRWELVALGLVLLALAPESTLGQVSRPRGPNAPRPPLPCEKSSCYPQTGNLLIGREQQLYATSTCGLDGQDRYCIVSHLEKKGEQCFRCDSRESVTSPALNHKISHVISRYKPGSRFKTWWQSKNGVENVSIGLDLEAEFHFTHIILVFKTFRPAAMLVERSFDFGNTWKVYRYFAHNCAESFPGVPTWHPRNLTEVVCESRYSGVAPSTDGEVILRVLPNNIQVENPYSQEVQNLLKITNLRINFTKLHTLGDDHLDDRPETQEKYYYAITDMTVRGSCSCYGHASICLPMEGVEIKQDMVHGRCHCNHNTKGLNCELCEDFYNDLPWKPAIGRTINACQRCNCNNHATSCHFDSAVYEQSGRVSGGVCDNCLHNTMGANCQLCKEYYYKDPELDMQDPEVCKDCDCDPRGSLDNGICDPITDVVNSLEAGRCHCKNNVEGRRCDTCKSGYWDFNETNPDGCQTCTCNALGTIDDYGCDVYTGECTCKRNVAGRDCNQCLAEHFGLGNTDDGCQRCDCDPGGSIDNNCDAVTGQCRCRPNVQGRRCDQPDQQFFAGSIDNLVYEAEYSNCNLESDINAISSSCQQAIREPFRDGREETWTGPGFMRVYEDDSLEFNVDDIATSMDYNIVIRYEPQVQGTWEDVGVHIERLEPPDLNGPCANADPNDDIKRVRLPDNERQVLVDPPVCLEEGKRYKIRITVNSQLPNNPNPRASILIDSIVLEPRIDTLPFYNSPAAEVWKRNMERDGCEIYINTVNEDIPEHCKKYHTSIGFYVFNGGIACECDPTGSTSYECKKYKGKCPCKKNVIGRKCNQCAPGTYGFDADGCKDCDCSNIGALDNFCTGNSGQCKCRQNTYGRQCDQCQPGYWNFPDCKRCECHGHADICDPKTGACIDCRDFTEGHKCGNCIEGYYGNPRIGKDIPCRPCPCPDTIASNHSFASRCELDPYNNDVICACQKGYAGARCDVCADNYFGNPETPGGSCEECDCSNNIDITKPGNCDSRTGVCLNCLYNTGGDNCENCKLGYFGNAVDRTCEECVCELLGTNSTIGACDQVTGQCPCFPNVIGRQCDSCLENHWRLASGEGCDYCDCDEIGSLSKQCNPFTGECECNPGFGGRQCDQCQANYWGDPNKECIPCECDPEGTLESQCMRDTGACVCKQGIGGYRCDMCARGYYGEDCIGCGECFDNWDRIISGLNNATSAAIDKASKIQVVGSVGAYTRDFVEMEKNLNNIELIINESLVEDPEVNAFNEEIKEIQDYINKTEKELIDFNKLLTNEVTSINIANISADDLIKRSKDLNDKVKELASNATKLQEANLEGALNLTREAKERAMVAADKVDKVQLTLRDTRRHLKSTEQLVQRQYESFNKTQKENDKNIERLQETLKELESQIPELNEKMCGATTDSCGICGGAGCGTCGGLACDRGAATISQNALEYADKTNAKIQEHELAADDLLRGIIRAKQNSSAAYSVAKEAYDIVSEYKNQTDSLMQNSSALNRDLEHFLSDSGVTPAEVRTLANEILNMSIDLTPERLQKLVNEISTTASKITDIESIIDETRQSLQEVKELKDLALSVKEDTNIRLNKTKNMFEAFEVAKQAQNEAEDAINTAKEEFNVLKGLPSVKNQLEDTRNQSKFIENQINELNNRLRNQQNNFLKITEDVKKIEAQVQQIKEKASNTQTKARELGHKHKETEISLNNRASQSANSRERAKLLSEEATNLAATTKNQLANLKKVDELYNSQMPNVANMQNTIKRLNNEISRHLSTIQAAAKFHMDCQ